MGEVKRIREEIENYFNFNCDINWAGFCQGCGWKIELCERNQCRTRKIFYKIKDQVLKILKTNP